jgi:hypothetical protein
MLRLNAQLVKVFQACIMHMFQVDEIALACVCQFNWKVTRHLRYAMIIMDTQVLLSFFTEQHKQSANGSQGEDAPSCPALQDMLFYPGHSGVNAGQTRVNHCG